MARYTLTGPQRSILTSWLFESHGYLADTFTSDGKSLLEAVRLDGVTDLYAYMHTTTKHPLTDQSMWNESMMVWWIRANEGVNITGGNRPPESALWVSILNGWGTSIDNAFQQVSQTIRDQQTHSITDEAGNVTTMPAGQHLLQQRNMITNVVPVLGG